MNRKISILIALSLGTGIIRSSSFRNRTHSLMTYFSAPQETPLVSTTETSEWHDLGLNVNTNVNTNIDTQRAHPNTNSDYFSDYFNTISLITFFLAAPDLQQELDNAATIIPNLVTERGSNRTMIKRSNINAIVNAVQNGEAPSLNGAPRTYALHVAFNSADCIAKKSRLISAIHFFSVVSQYS